MKGVGKLDEVKEVSDGYAQNFLIPKGYVIRATPELLKKIQEKKQGDFVAKTEKERVLAELLARLAKTQSITMSDHPHAKGDLYKAITAQEIAHAIKNQHDIFIAKDLVHSDKPIKSTGEHTIFISDGKQKISYKVLVS